MARAPKPWFRDDRNAYFVTVNGTRHNLGPDKAEAERKFHELMAQKPEPARPAAGPLLAAEVFDKFLDWCQKHRAPRTYDWYLEHVQGFLNSLPDRRIAAEDLRPFHVVEWADRHANWGDTYRRGAIVGVQRPFNWAEKLGYIDRNPIKHVEKPQPTRREQAVSPAEWVTIRDHYPPGDAFRLLLEFAWETGCRPQEVKGIEARHCDLKEMRVEFPPTEAKGKKRWRVIHLTPRAADILAGLLPGRETGMVFLNAKGRPWTAFSMSCRFGRLKKTLGVKYAGYSLRHGFCQKLLEGGADHVTVAALMGHADAGMVSRVYSHMNKADGHLKETLRRASD